MTLCQSLARCWVYTAQYCCRKLKLLLNKWGTSLVVQLRVWRMVLPSLVGSLSVLNLNDALPFFAEDTIVPIQGQSVQKKKIVGGILLKFALRNHSESRSQCLALFTDLYSKVEEKVRKGDHKYTFDKLSRDLTALQIDYYQKAIGPARWEVYAEKESFIKSQEESYERLHGFKKEAFDALQKAAEEKARNDQLNDTLYELKVQMKNDTEMNQKRMTTMQKEHKEEMNRLHEEQQERLEKDRQKYEDFMKARLEDMAEITKENREDLQQQYDAMFKTMEAMNEQNQKSLKAVSESVETMKTAIRNMRKYVYICLIVV